MSASSFVIDLRKSLVVTDPADFPMNMGKTSKEDYPVDMYPILAYEASNVLGTAFGYKSFFDESTKLNIGALTGKKVQAIFTYQSSTLDNIQWALCEDGIYVAYATMPTGVNWAQVVDLSAGELPDVRRMWSHAVIANRVYLYQQGSDKFWTIVDPAKYAEAASPSLIAGATIAQVWTNWGCGLISYVPSFLNMAGQIGIFRADNRLGFWDSDSAVAWSSAVAIEDFTPSVTTFAGVTKFADVQGRIIKILGSGDGFIIYSTRSIVNCLPLEGSPEKWKGEAILSGMGVSFDTQVVSAQPDQIHYCITAAGLLSITQGNPEYIATEVMDALVENSPLYSLFLIEGRYLFLATGVEFPGATFSSESVLVNDSEGNAFIFPKPTYPDPETDPGNYLAEYIAGRNADVQAALDDYEPIVPVDSIPKDSLLIPCFDVKIFKSTWAETTFAPYTNNNEFFYSKLQAFSYDYVGPTIVEPLVTHNSITMDDIAPGDFVGEEVVEKLDLGMAAFNRNLAYQTAAEAAIDTDYPVNVHDDHPIPPPGYDGEFMIADWPKELIGEKKFFDAVSLEDLRIKSNKCRTRLYINKERSLRIRTYFTGQETYGAAPLVGGFWSQKNWLPAYAAYLPAISTPLYGIAVPYTAELEAEYVARWTDVFGSPPDLVTRPIIVGGYLGPQQGSSYASWCVANYYPQCVAFGASLGELLGVQQAAFELRATNSSVGSLYPVPATSELDIYFFDSPLFNVAWYMDVDNGPHGGRSYTSGPYIGEEIVDDWLDLVGVYRQMSYHASYTSWTTLQKQAAMASVPGGGSDGYNLTGIISHEVDYPKEQSDEHTVYEMEVSGWGYINTISGTFRKTHSRKSGTTCPMPPSGSGQISVPDIVLPTIPPLDPPNYRSPPVVWDYPDSIPLPDNYALFNKGSLAAYYPTYNAAVVYDLLLTKWGMYNNSFKLLQELMPVNRVDASIMPVSDKGMFGGALNPDWECTVFKDKNPDSYIVYGKMGFYRHGMNFASGAVAHFGNRATGTLIVEASMDGVTLEPSMSYAVSFEDQLTVFLPFTCRAKWFNIRVEGNFNLVYLELSAESRGRR